MAAGNLTKKPAQALFYILVQIDSAQFLQKMHGNSAKTNNGWKGETFVEKAILGNFYAPHQ